MLRPIGVFDSGVGGLTVLRELMRVLPRESTVYLGDNARLPYGGQPVETIRRYTLECLDHLYRRGVKALVIACNSATTAALEAAQERYDVPVVGVVEATARTAARLARSRVGVMATPATVRGGIYARTVMECNPSLEVLQQPCPRLASLVEAGELTSNRTRKVLAGYLSPLLEKGIDCLVLGCTHYGYLRPIIEELAGPDVGLVECAPPTVASLQKTFDEGALERSSAASPSHRLCTTGTAEAFGRAASALWPGALPEIEEVTVEVDHGTVRRETA
ncbi:MAG: glutamate racemase [Sphingomonadaceae bacterium]